ncbi:MAG: hypothetical protein JWQ76_5251 [Ramlibacter sp.]|nr:hypothetical protein [Ramlibacter sp.]
MIANPSTGRFAFEMPAQAQPDSMQASTQSGLRCGGQGKTEGCEVQVFAVLIRGLHEGLHSEFSRVVDPDR